MVWPVRLSSGTGTLTLGRTACSLAGSSDPQTRRAPEEPLALPVEHAAQKAAGKGHSLCAQSPQVPGNGGRDLSRQFCLP